MIIPIEFNLSRVLEEEDFDIDDLFPEIIEHTPSPELRLTVKLFDTERMIMRGIGCKVVPDHDQPKESELAMIYSMPNGRAMTKKYEDYLRDLRSEIDKILGDS